MRVQKEPPQDVPLWDVDCSGLKAILAAGSKETSAPPFNYLEELELGAMSIISDYPQ